MAMASCIFCAGAFGAMESIEDKTALAGAFPPPLSVEKIWKVATSNQLDRVEKATGLKQKSSLFAYYEATRDGKVEARALISSSQGKHGLIRFMVVLEPDHTVRNVRVLAHREQWGEGIVKKKFLAQYIGKGSQDKIRLNADIQGITGATISSRAMSTGVRNAVRKISIILEEKEPE